MKQRLGYLAGAARVSTDPEATGATGARAHVLGVMKAFETLGWDVKPFIVGDRVPQKWAKKGAEQAAVDSGFFRALAADLVRLILAVKNSRQAWRELDGQVDWVYERFGSFQSLGRLFRRHGIPWILETNGPFFYEARSDRKSIALAGLARWLEIKAYQEADVLVCISRALKEIIVQEASILPEKVVVVPNGVDTVFFEPQRYEAKRTFESFTIGFVGNLFAWQGLDLLLEALSDLKAENIILSLVVVGDGPMRSAWETKAEQLGIASNVMFVGRVAWLEIPQQIASFDIGYSGQIHMQVGKMYHSPLKLYEYMAMAKPVVASAFEDAQRVIQQGETGFLFQPGDKDDLKHTLTQAYRAWAVLPGMGCKAREEIVANHSWINRVQTLVEEAEQILKMRKLQSANNHHR